MELNSSSEANDHSTTQEIPHLLQNPNVHYYVHNSLLLVHVFSQINLALTFIPFLLYKIYFINTILPSEPKS